MGRDEVKDILALADIEEEDEVIGVGDADSLSFRWGVPQG
jgi:hypothetical protein